MLCFILIAALADDYSIHTYIPGARCADTILTYGDCQAASDSLIEAEVGSSTTVEELDGDPKYVEGCFQISHGCELLGACGTSKTQVLSWNRPAVNTGGWRRMTGTYGGHRVCKGSVPEITECTLDLSSGVDSVSCGGYACIAVQNGAATLWTTMNTVDGKTWPTPDPLLWDSIGTKTVTEAKCAYADCFVKFEDNSLLMWGENSPNGAILQNIAGANCWKHTCAVWGTPQNNVACDEESGTTDEPRFIVWSSVEDLPKTSNDPLYGWTTGSTSIMTRPVTGIECGEYICILKSRPLCTTSESQKGWSVYTPWIAPKEYGGGANDGGMGHYTGYNVSCGESCIISGINIHVLRRAVGAFMTTGQTSEGVTETQGHRSWIPAVFAWHGGACGGRMCASISDGHTYAWIPRISEGSQQVNPFASIPDHHPTSVSCGEFVCVSATTASNTVAVFYNYKNHHQTLKSGTDKWERTVCDDYFCHVHFADKSVISAYGPGFLQAQIELKHYRTGEDQNVASVTCGASMCTILYTDGHAVTSMRSEKQTAIYTSSTVIGGTCKGTPNEKSEKCIDVPGVEILGIHIGCFDKRYRTYVFVGAIAAAVIAVIGFYYIIRYCVTPSEQQLPPVNAQPNYNTRSPDSK